MARNALVCLEARSEGLAVQTNKIERAAANPRSDKLIPFVFMVTVDVI